MSRNPFSDKVKLYTQKHKQDKYNIAVKNYLDSYKKLRDEYNDFKKSRNQQRLTHIIDSQIKYAKLYNDLNPADRFQQGVTIEYKCEPYKYRNQNNEIVTLNDNKIPLNSIIYETLAIGYYMLYDAVKDMKFRNTKPRVAVGGAIGEQNTENNTVQSKDILIQKIMDITNNRNELSLQQLSLDELAKIYDHEYNTKVISPVELHEHELRYSYLIDVNYTDRDRFDKKTGKIKLVYWSNVLIPNDLLTYDDHGNNNAMHNSITAAINSFIQNELANKNIYILDLVLSYKLKRVDPSVAAIYQAKHHRGEYIVFTTIKIFDGVKDWNIFNFSFDADFEDLIDTDTKFYNRDVHVGDLPYGDDWRQVAEYNKRERQSRGIIDVLVPELLKDLHPAANDAKLAHINTIFNNVFVQKTETDEIQISSRFNDINEKLHEYNMEGNAKVALAIVKNYNIVPNISDITYEDLVIRFAKFTYQGYGISLKLPENQKGDCMKQLLRDFGYKDSVIDAFKSDNEWKIDDLLKFAESQRVSCYILTLLGERYKHVHEDKRRNHNKKAIYGFIADEHVYPIIDEVLQHGLASGGWKLNFQSEPTNSKDETPLQKMREIFTDDVIIQTFCVSPEDNHYFYKTVMLPLPKELISEEPDTHDETFIKAFNRLRADFIYYCENGTLDRIFTYYLKIHKIVPKKINTSEGIITYMVLPFKDFNITFYYNPNMSDILHLVHKSKLPFRNQSYSMIARDVAKLDNYDLTTIQSTLNEETRKIFNSEFMNKAGINLNFENNLRINATEYDCIDINKSYSALYIEYPVPVFTINDMPRKFNQTDIINPCTLYYVKRTLTTEEDKKDLELLKAVKNQPFEILNAGNWFYFGNKVAYAMSINILRKRHITHFYEPSRVSDTLQKYVTHVYQKYSSKDAKPMINCLNGSLARKEGHSSKTYYTSSWREACISDMLNGNQSVKQYQVDKDFAVYQIQIDQKKVYRISTLPIYLFIVQSGHIPLHKLASKIKQANCDIISLKTDCVLFRKFNKIRYDINNIVKQIDDCNTKLIKAGHTISVQEQQKLARYRLEEISHINNTNSAYRTILDLGSSSVINNDFQNIDITDCDDIGEDDFSDKLTETDVKSIKAALRDLHKKLDKLITQYTPSTFDKSKLIKTDTATMVPGDYRQEDITKFMDRTFNIRPFTTLRNKTDYTGRLDTSEYETTEIYHSPTEQDVIEWAQKYPNGFLLTGNAGVGKSFVLKKLRDFYKIQYGEDRAVQRLAFTNAVVGSDDDKGMTIHKFFDLDFTAEALLHIWKDKFSHIKVILIDEVSLIPTHLYEHFHVLKSIGVIFYLFGDFNQINPIEKQGYPALINYENAPMVQQLANYTKTHLNKNHRSDAEFIQAALGDRYDFVYYDGTIVPGWQRYITRQPDLKPDLFNICAVKGTRDRVNKECAKIYGELGEIGSMMVLEKQPKKITLHRNSIWQVIAKTKTEITIDQMFCGSEFKRTETLSLKVWNDYVVSGMFQLGYCLTVERCQGMTINIPYKIYDIREMNKSKIYVALSRCTKPSDIMIDTRNKRANIYLVYNNSTRYVDYATYEDEMIKKLSGKGLKYERLCTMTYLNIEEVHEQIKEYEKIKNRNIGYVYKISNTKTSMVYIGSTNNIDRRWEEHKERVSTGAESLYEHMRMHGSENFKIETIKVILNASKNALQAEEDLLIKEYMHDMPGCVLNCKVNIDE